jgi:hypothetical protein
MDHAILRVDGERAVLEGTTESERLESDAVVSLEEWA